MTWQLLLAAYIVLGTAVRILRRSLGQSLAPHNRLVNAVFFAGALYPAGLLVAFFSSPDLAIGWGNFALLVAGSGIFPVIIMLMFRANKDVDAGLNTILGNLTPIITIIAASLLLNERLNDQQLLGAVIIILSTFLATLPLLRKRSTSSSSGVLISLLSVLLLGVAIVYERWMLTKLEFGAYLVFGWGSQTFWMLVLAWPERQNIHLLRKKKYLLPIATYSVVGALTGLTFVSSLKLSGNASVVSAFSSFMSISVVLAAYFLLKEREWLLYKIGAALLGVVGLVILNLA